MSTIFTKKIQQIYSIKKQFELRYSQFYNENYSIKVYPGTRDEKLLDSQIGNLLSSKLGGRIVVEQLIQEEKLVLLPLSDIRGYDTTGMKAGIYISEAQNLDIDLMKLALQRIGEDGLCIIDGDCKTQVDDIQFAGSRNGMKRLSQVFRGHSIYGEITLKNIHRSKIAKIAELL